MGLGLNYTTWGIKEIPLLTVLSVFTLLTCAVAYYRRSLLPEAKVFGVSFKAFFLSMNAEILEKPESKIEKILALLLIF